jgi:hypothetical protein
MSASILADIQSAVVAQISAQPFFTGGPNDGAAVPVLGENKRDILSDIQAKIARLGACAIVAIADAPVKYPNIPGPRYEIAEILVYCYERPTVNRGATGTGKTALQIAEAVAACLHQVTIPVEGCTPMSCTGLSAAPAGEGEVAYQVKFNFAAGGGTAEREVPLVVWSDSVLDAGFVPAEQTHTIDCGTP